MKYAYYPGCSSQNLTMAYETSLQSVSSLLGLDLETIADWNCCGATVYMAVDRLASYAIAARNLALVPGDCEKVVASCSACVLNLKRVENVMATHDTICSQVNDALGTGNLSYTPGRLEIRHLLDVFIHDIGLAHIRERVKRPLSHLKVAPYYGCMLVRPMSCFEQPEYPVGMDRLMEVLGAEVVDFSLRGYCCGGHMPQIKADTGFEIIHHILKDAHDHGANCIAVTCPVCQLNLDLYQQDVNDQYGTDFDFPILFFTQVMGLAFGLDDISLGFGREIVSVERLLENTPPANPSSVPSETVSKGGLPMPGQTGDEIP